MSATASSADRLLREQTRWLRSAWPLAIAAAGLAITLAVSWWWHPSWARVEKWEALSEWWICGVGVTFASSTGVWLFLRRSLLLSAQRLDDRLAAKNRVETATMLRDASDAIAQAQREETVEFLEHAPVRARGTPLRVLIAFVFVLAFSHLVTLVSWTRPWASAAHRDQKTAKPAPTPAPLPTATIKWKSPKAETKAAPIEEVPLEAMADSSSGLRELSLEIQVNGEQKLSVPVSIEALEKPGPHKIQASLYLDQLEVQPYDMVSYHLRARRIADQHDLPETVSPVQFVQVKPFRDDVREMPGGDGQSLFPLVTALKGAQLRLLKENFLLAHTDLAHDNAEWRKENERVGKDQAVLEQKTGEAIHKLIDKGAPAEIVNLISQAKPLMADAAEKIQVAANQQALASQGKSLGLITEVEKFFSKIAAREGSSRGPKRLDDPFKDKKQLELKQRFKTHAGELELLAKEQARLAEDLANPAPSSESAEAKPDPNKIEGTTAERQTQISQRVGALLNGQVFVPEVTKHLEQGREQAKASLRHLDADDPVAAIEPSAGAARELRLAVEAMNKAAEDDSKDQLATALRELNKAADTARNAPDQDSDEKGREAAKKATEQAGKARQDAAEAAKQQQDTGSEKEAKRLANLANALNDPKLLDKLQKLRERPRDRARAEAAAQQLGEIAQRTTRQPSGDSPKDELAKIVERLERGRTNLARLAEQEGKQTGESSKPASGTEAEQNGRQGQQGEQGESDKSEEQSKGEGKSPGQGRGEGDESGTGKGSGGGSNGVAGTARERFARELLEDLQEATDDGYRLLPNSTTQLDELRDAIREATRNPDRPAANTPAYFTALQKPLGNVIDLIRAELHSALRKHELKDQHAEQAPPAYRAAVDDYFERLSRDYEEAKKEE